MWNATGSLRGKISLGYYAVGTLIVGLAVFALLELNWIEAKIRAGETVSELFDATLEIRRFEKNYFLYHQEADLRENLDFVQRALDLLNRNAADFLAPPRYAALRGDLEGHVRLGDDTRRLREGLEKYLRLMTDYGRSGAASGVQGDAMEQDIRAVGRDVVATAEKISQTERRMLETWLKRYRRGLIVAIVALTVLVVLAGQALSKAVAKPLKEMEDSMEAVARGRLQKLDMRAGDREIVSLTTAFNHVLDELDVRKKHMVRSEKLASLGTLLSGVAHELNNPLSNISTSTQILLEEGDQADAAFQRELLAQIDEQTERARAIVRSLLDFARDRAFKLEPVPLRALLEETVRFLKGQIPVDVEITLDLPEGLVVAVDRQRMQRVFLNLIKNAVEASHAGGAVRIHAASYMLTPAQRAADAAHDRFHGECDVAPAGVDIEIADRGSGIAPGALKRIFDPFFTTKDVGKGSGLGLFIVYEIVEEHGGCIAVESREGEGTTFFIRLPRKAASQEKP